MKEWALAIVIAASLIKVFTLGDGRSTLQIGVPWLVPFDSPAAACLRSPDAPIIECGAGAIQAHKSLAVEIADLPPCRWCFDASIEISKMFVAQDTADRRMRELRALAP